MTKNELKDFYLDAIEKASTIKSKYLSNMATFKALDDLIDKTFEEGRLVGFEEGKKVKISALTKSN
jgi:hypothetical protein